MAISNVSSSNTPLQIQNVENLEQQLDSKANQSNLTSHTGRTDNPHAVTKTQVGLSNVTNDAQVKSSQVGVAGGVAPLDSNNFIPLDFIPVSLLGALRYIALWNATTNNPPIPSASSSNKGWYYRVSVAGTTNISGISEWQVGDWLVSNGTVWDKIDNSEISNDDLTTTAQDPSDSNIPKTLRSVISSIWNRILNHTHSVIQGNNNNNIIDLSGSSTQITSSEVYLDGVLYSGGISTSTLTVSDELYVNNGTSEFNNISANHIDAGSLSISSNNLQISGQGLGTSAFKNVGTGANDVSTGNHSHDASAITSGTIDISRIGTGTKNSTTVLRGDGTFDTVADAAQAARTFKAGPLTGNSLPTYRAIDFYDLPANLAPVQSQIQNISLASNYVGGAISLVGPVSTSNINCGDSLSSIATAVAGAYGETSSAVSVTGTSLAPTGFPDLLDGTYSSTHGSAGGGNVYDFANASDNNPNTSANWTGTNTAAILFTFPSAKRLQKIRIKGAGTFNIQAGNNQFSGMTSYISSFTLTDNGSWLELTPTDTNFYYSFAIFGPSGSSVKEIEFIDYQAVYDYGNLNIDATFQGSLANMSLNPLSSNTTGVISKVKKWGTAQGVAVSQEAFQREVTNRQDIGNSLRLLIDSKSGLVWRNATGVPSDSLGANGDYYINNATGDVYFKSLGSYGSSILNIKGTTGSSGIGYGGSSTTSNTIGTGSLTFTTQSGLAYTVGSRIRVSNSSSNYVEGVITSYSGTSITLTSDTFLGSGTFSSWNLSVAGNVGSNGTNGLGYGGTSTTSNSVAMGTKTFAVQSGLAYVIGNRVRATYPTTPTNYVEGLITAYSGGSLTISVDATGGSGTFASWNFGIAGSVGLSGNNGVGYGGTSATSLLIGIGSKTFTTQAGLAYVVGSRMRFASNANPINYMEGLVTSYSTTSLTVTIDAVGGSGTFSDWNLSIAGAAGTNGTSGAGYGGTSTTSLVLGLGSKTFTTQSGLAYQVGARLRASNSLNAVQYVEGLITAYSGTTLTINSSKFNGSGTVSSWLFNVAGEPGSDGQNSTGGGGSSSITDNSYNFSTSILTYGSQTNGVISSVGKSCFVRSFSDVRPCRWRFYATDADRIADISRSNLTTGNGVQGLLAEFVLSGTLLSIDCGPLPFLSNNDNPRTASIYYQAQCLDSNGGILSPTINYTQLQ